MGYDAERVIEGLKRLVGKPLPFLTKQEKAHCRGLWSHWCLHQAYLHPGLSAAGTRLFGDGWYLDLFHIYRGFPGASTEIVLTWTRDGKPQILNIGEIPLDDEGFGSWLRDQLDLVVFEGKSK